MAILGVGTDLLSVHRIRKLVEMYGDRFALRVLGHEELLEYSRRISANFLQGVRYLAKRFCAKEAVGKALGVGIRVPISFHAIQVLNDISGKPKLVPSAVLSEYLNYNKISLEISLSDESDYVLAFVIAETQ